MVYILTSGQELYGGGWYTTVERAPLLFNMFFGAFINVAYTRFKVDEDIMDALVHLVVRAVWWVPSQTHYLSAEVVSPILVHEGFLFRPP